MPPIDNDWRRETRNSRPSGRMLGGRRPFKTTADVVGSRPSSFQPVARRAPNYQESSGVRSERMKDLVKGQLSAKQGTQLQSFHDPAYTVGKPNPFGRGSIHDYEPNTEIFDEYAKVYTEVQAEKARVAAAAAAAEAERAQAQADRSMGASRGGGGTIRKGGGGSPAINADGKVKSMIQYAMGMVGKFYIWGGTTSRGVDCSGLIYYAFNAAGIRIARYRAIDYGRMGRAVSIGEALPGDIVYIDNRNSTTDHVGIYIGNGQMIESPTTGQRTKVSRVGNRATSIRRILTDGQLGRMAAPPKSSGGVSRPVPSYAGRRMPAPVKSAPRRAAPAPAPRGSSRWL